MAIRGSRLSAPWCLQLEIVEADSLWDERWYAACLVGHARLHVYCSPILLCAMLRRSVRHAWGETPD